MADRNKKGQFTDGNKGGPDRPKLSDSIPDAFRAVLNESPSEGTNNLDLIVRKVVSQAQKGCIRSASLIFDRVGGRPFQQVYTEPDREPVILREIGFDKLPVEASKAYIDASLDGSAEAMMKFMADWDVDELSLASHHQVELHEYRRANGIPEPRVRVIS